MNTALLPLLGIAAPPNRKRRGALIVPSAGPGSIGDDAMIMSLVTELEDAGEGPVNVLALGGRDGWPDVSPAGLIALPRGKRRALTLAGVLRRVKRVYVVGADCIDGHYSLGLSLQLIGIANAGAHAGALATIVGCSYKESPKPETVNALGGLHARARVCGRDPRTVERVKGLAKRSSELVTDSAFMLRPTEPGTPNAPRDLAWIAERRRAGRVLLGVNFNRQVLGRDPDEAATAPLFEAYARTISGLLESHPELDVVFIPHDYRGKVSDADHARLLAERVGRPDRAIALQDRYRASEIKHFASQMDLVLTGRMHLAIESLGAGVPVCCVTYQDKFEGLFDHFRMEPIVLSPEASTPDALRAMVEGALDRRDQLREHVARELPRVRAMSRQNLGLGEGSTGA